MPIAAAKRVAPATIAFVLYNLATDASASVAEFSALIAGFACGLVMAGSVSEPKASVRRIAIAAAAMLAAAVAVAVPVRGIGEVVDATPELQRVVTEEERTTTTFRAAADQFNTGRITAEALAEVIERGILPTVRATRERFDLLQKVTRNSKRWSLLAKNICGCGTKAGVYTLRPSVSPACRCFARRTQSRGHRWRFLARLPPPFRLSVKRSTSSSPTGSRLLLLPLPPRCPS